MAGLAASIPNIGRKSKRPDRKSMRLIRSGSHQLRRRKGAANDVNAVNQSFKRPMTANRRSVSVQL